MKKHILDDFEIIPYSKKYFEQWRDLYTKTTQRQQPGNFFVYNTTQTPFGKPIQFLMRYKDKIIGSHTIRPFHYRIKGKTVLGGQTYNSLTDPAYQKRGIFTALVNATQTEAKNQNYQFVCGYANANSIDIYQKELQHKKLQEINFIKITEFEKVRGHGLFLIGINKIPAAIPTGRLNNIENQFTCAVLKDIPYLKWRYEQKHHEGYTVFYQHCEFLIITKRYEQQEQIVDFFVNDAYTFRRALSIIADVAKRDGISDITMWIPANHHLLKEAAIKYETIVAKQFFHVVSFNENLTQYIIDSQNWNYSMGDSDVY